jgi:ribosome small subunit-dependent GTPase A
LLVLNKCDLPEECEAWETLEMEKIYSAAEVELLQVSTTTGEGLEALRQRITGQVVLVAGQSGVGKSSLLNTLDSSLSARVAPLSEQHGLGVHTTTFSEMYKLTTLPNTFVIDTPGIKGFGVVDFEKSEVAHFFPEIFALSRHCKYSNCLHETEPDCAVRAAYEAGTLAESRYRSYLSILYEDKSYR